MHRYRVALCDDQQLYREQLHMLLTKYQQENDCTFEIYSYSSGEELLQNTNIVFHIILLDIEMEKISGIEVARRIRSKDDYTQIIFVTSHDSYAFNAYELDAIGYLLKPISYEVFKKQLTKAIITIEYFNDKLLSAMKYIDIKIKNEVIKLNTNHIIYIEKRRNTIIIYTSSTSYTIYDTLSNLYSRLDSQKFIYIHQGYIVNYAKILNVEGSYIVMEGNIQLPISRKYYKSTKERFMNDLYTG